MGQIEIKEVSPDEPILQAKISQYTPIFERILRLKSGDRFRAVLEGKVAARIARTRALSFAVRNNVPVTTSIKDNTLEVRWRD